MFGMEDFSGKGTSRPGLGGKEISERSGVGSLHPNGDGDGTF